MAERITVRLSDEMEKKVNKYHKERNHLQMNETLRDLISLGLELAEKRGYLKKEE